MRLLPIAFAAALLGCNGADDDVDTDEVDSADSDEDTSEPLDPDCLAWPLAGEDGKDWVVQNYVDQTQGDGMLDYMGSVDEAAKTYDDHDGIDIDIPTFRDMDAGVEIFASQGGRVTWTNDGLFDRNTSCDSWDWNAVNVLQDDGIEVYYGHMRNGSVAATVGQRVERGDVLGQVGSSGCSTHPHLHIELRRNGDIVDPFEEGMWCDAPAYTKPTSVLAAVLLEAPVDDYDEPFKDPPSDVSAIDSGTMLLPILHAADGAVGETIGVILRDPSGGVQADYEFPFESVYRHSWWYWTVWVEGAAGEWTVDYKANGETQRSVVFEVR